MLEQNHISVNTEFAEHENVAHATDEVCFCEGFAPHKIQITPHQLKTQAEDFEIPAIRLELPFALSNKDGVSVPGLAYESYPGALNTIGQAAFLLFRDGDSLKSGYETISFSRYSAIIGYAALKGEVVVKNEVVDIFRTVGCSNLEFNERRAGF